MLCLFLFADDFLCFLLLLFTCSRSYLFLLYFCGVPEFCFGSLSSCSCHKLSSIWSWPNEALWSLSGEVEWTLLVSMPWGKLLWCIDLSMLNISKFGLFFRHSAQIRSSESVRLRMFLRIASFWPCYLSFYSKYSSVRVCWVWCDWATSLGCCDRVFVSSASSLSSLCFSPEFLSSSCSDIILGLGVMVDWEFCLLMLPVYKTFPLILWERANSTGLSFTGD